MPDNHNSDLPADTADVLGPQPIPGTPRRPHCIHRKEGGAVRFRGVLLHIHDEGYAFIHTETSGDFYVNISSMQDRAEWKEGLLVSFLPGTAKPGNAPPAYQVRAVHSPRREA
jgi:cold shock CspA family protein